MKTCDNWKPKSENLADDSQATRGARTKHEESSPKKVIDPAPIIKELADWCLAAKGLECSILGNVIDKLRAAPAVKVAEERHGWWEYGRWEKGHWVKGNERCRCSVCHRDFAVDNSNVWNGCPHCLAKMGGER